MGAVSLGEYAPKRRDRQVNWRGAKRALMAVGQTLLAIIYQVLCRRQAYRELRADDYDRLQPEQFTRHLVHRLEQLRHKVAREGRALEEP